MPGADRPGAAGSALARLLILPVLAACVEYGAKAEPTPPAFPEEPDGRCPAYVPYSTVGIAHTFTLDTTEDLEPSPMDWFGDLYDGAEEYAGVSSWLVTDFDENGAPRMERHYACDDGNVYVLAHVGATGPEACRCDTDCFVSNYVYDPPILAWWDAAAESPVTWSSGVYTRRWDTSVIDCVATDWEPEEFEVTWTLSSSAPADLDTPLGTFPAVRVDVATAPCEPLCWADWYSPGYGEVQWQSFGTVSGGTYRLASMTLPNEGDGR